MPAQGGGLPRLPTPPTIVNRPHSSTNRQPLKQARLGLFVRQVGWLHRLPPIPSQPLQPAVASQAALTQKHYPRPLKGQGWVGG